MRFLRPALLLMTHALAAWAAAPVPGCSVSAASPWITRWLTAWELTSRDILHLPDAPPPSIVFYDSACVYTTSGVTAGGAASGDGPALRGTKLPWRAITHGDSLTRARTARTGGAMKSSVQTVYSPAGKDSRPAPPPARFAPKIPRKTALIPDPPPADHRGWNPPAGGTPRGALPWPLMRR